MVTAARVAFKDVTLREGAQAPPVSFTLDEKCEIAVALADVGVHVIQVGFAGREDDHVARIRGVCPSTTLEVLAPSWDPGVVDALTSAFAAGADMCGILARAGDGALASLGLSQEEAVERLGEVVGEAARIGYSEIRIALSYASEADPTFRDALYERGLAAGGTSIGYADTPGTATPEKVRAAVGELARAFPRATINSHMHNDFGLAVANTLAAVDAGATLIDVSVLGLGDRAGNCPLDEAAVALDLLYQRETGLDLSKLYELSRLVARLSGEPIPRMKPIVGEDCFSHKLDMKVAAIASGKVSYEAFDPALIGRTSVLKLGYGSGPAAVQAVAAELGLAVPDEAIPALVAAVNDLAVAEKRCVTTDEFRELTEAQLGDAASVG